MVRRFFIATLATAILCCCSTTNPRQVEDFNFDWKFILADDASFASPSFNDTDWRDLHLPHDWSIEGDFSESNPSTPSGGALPGGTGWYRKHFKTPAGVGKGKVCSIEFDGVFMNSTVYVNGKEIGTRPYGYSSFSYEITDALNPVGKDNLIAVRCDNAEQPNSRWYAGCGIYRNVRLVTTDKTHVAYDGVYVTTPEINSSKATVKVAVEAENLGADNGIFFKVLDSDGNVVATGSNDTFDISNPHLWDIENPYLYTLEVSITAGEDICDTYTQTFGIRSFGFDADKGFFLNGKSVKLKGVCLHHDMGCIGTAVHHRALERELGILKDMGVNSIRTSHNPPAPELLQLCDEMGFVVMDEAFDMWKRRKTRYDYARFFDEWHVKDLEDFVRRDRNHPSIIMWSIGNEVPEQMDRGDESLENLSPEEANFLLNFSDPDKSNDPVETNPNVLLARHLAKVIRDLDDTRAITSGCNNVYEINNLFVSGALDVFGLNYNSNKYEDVREWFPGQPLIGSETASAINSRGVYHFPSTKFEVLPNRNIGLYPEALDTPMPEDNQLTAFDMCCVPWGATAEKAWYAVRENDFIAGTYLWTGFDYLGEPTPFPWPARSSYFGVVDLAGFPKDSYWMYMSEWTDRTVLHLLPHWNWNNGDIVDVWAYYNNADEVELFLNGKSLGKSRKDGQRLHAQWLGITYEPGTIEAVSYKDGKEVARDSRTTSGSAVAVRLTADRDIINADGYDLSYITVDAIDAEGRIVPTANDMLHFSVKGAGELFGVDNGNASDTLSLKGNDKALFSGKALGVIRSLKGQKGTATLCVNAYGRDFEITVKSE